MLLFNMWYLVCSFRCQCISDYVIEVYKVSFEKKKNLHLCDNAEYFGSALNVMTFNLEIFYPLCSVVLEIGLLTHQYLIMFCLLLVKLCLCSCLLCWLYLRKRKRYLKWKRNLGIVLTIVLERKIMREDNITFNFIK